LYFEIFRYFSVALGTKKSSEHQCISYMSHWHTAFRKSERSAHYTLMVAMIDHELVSEDKGMSDSLTSSKILGSMLNDSSIGS
jgi:hypothetical protein